MVDVHCTQMLSQKAAKSSASAKLPLKWCILASLANSHLRRAGQSERLWRQKVRAEELERERKKKKIS